ncbi:NusG domain II-containing protein [Azonexus sp. IMCC34839]|uniref:NusG domain II-containing protein n=1 Tax=Azonexus sp. IMCC34839 TaxID=3133695 RepID=UPI00399A1B71
MKLWLSLIRPGDWLVALLGAALVAGSVPLFWQGGLADRAIVRQEGKVFAEVDLKAKRQLEVPGPLGTTVIAVEPGRARVVADPGPRQYCVKQGWLMRPGEIAICAPNRVSLQITGRTKVYDSISY